MGIEGKGEEDRRGDGMRVVFQIADEGLAVRPSIDFI